jgi:hypothetical protein
MASSMYGVNPYSTLNTNYGYGYGYNEDFMTNAMGTNAYAQALAQQYATPQTIAQQPATDTYQPSTGSSSLNDGLKLGLVGGVGAGAGVYFFGDKLGASYTTDGKTFSDELLKAYQTDPKELIDTKVAEKIAEEKNTIYTTNGFINEKEFEAIKKYVRTEASARTSLPEEITKLVPETVKNNPEGAKDSINKAIDEIDAIDKNVITEQITKEVNAGNLAHQTEELANLTKRKSLLDGLAKDAKPEQIEELITKNPKAFGIEKTAEAEIKAEAKTIAEKYGTKAGALAEVTPLVKAQGETINSIRTGLNTEVAGFWDSTAKAFRADAPETLTKAVKNFKWAKAGKFGAIAAGVGLALGCLFGGSKS